jgi:outer membrane beta-barrel protein
MPRLFRTVPLLLALLVSPRAALAQEGAQAPEEELVERVVVRNRLYTSAGRLELSPTAGLTVLNRLTAHYNFNLNAAFNFTETLGVEARGGWALSSLTGLARDLRDDLARRDPARNEDIEVSDLRDLWQMNGNLALGARWMPIYGKVNLLGDIPVHFQAYLWAGGGVANFVRESVAYCQQVAPDGTLARGTCSAPLVERRAGVIGSAAAGMRFFVHKGGALRLELRDYLYPDSYRVRIVRADAEAGRTTGTVVNSGITNLVMADVGYTFIF